MNIGDTKKALLTAARAYERALRAKSCGLASNNIRLGQQWEQRARDGMRKNIPAKMEVRYMSPARRELLELAAQLPNAEYNAHLHRLQKCGVTEMEHMRRAAEDRVNKTDSARERQYRKRPKKRTKS